ncbi:PREDICTED: cation/H(+) antiporter 1-like isoform X2 [Ipomoea nil]|nr:PREDICTED: cation/H(+) antiporter 1-like isoform X2 [Ipomoea nil]
MLGPSGLSLIPEVKSYFLRNFVADYYEFMAVLFRIIIMFLIGLEMDFPYFIRKLRQVGIIACGSSLMCTFFAAAITSFVYQETSSHGSAFMMGLMITIILASTASPVVIRLAADLKFATSDIGRMAISSALINDAYGVVLLFAISKTRQHYTYTTWFFLGLLYLFTVALVVVVNMYVANWMNRRNRNQKYLKNAEMFGLLAILYIVAMSLELMGFSSLIFSFLIGSMFPRGGKAARTLLIKLTYPVHNFILPIYFGYLGFKANVAYIDSVRNFCIVFFIMLLSFGGKIVGTLAACYHLKIPYYEGVLMAFLMNLKGHVDLLALTIGSTNKIILSDTFYGLMVSAVVINSLVWGPIIAFMVRREHDIIGYRQIYFETQAPECELRLLACVHGPRPVATMVGLIAASRGPENVPLTPYLMHLVELPGKSNTTLMYNQKEEDEVSDDDDYGGNEVVEINDAVDIFTAETGVMVHQMKAVSPLSSMYKDVCDHAEDIRASIILLPFHKHQRIDGKLETSKDGIRTTNQKVLRFSPCAVAILVDRGLTAGSLNITNTDSLQHIATLFFGGPDDREALGFSKRLGMHNHINLTVIRFLSASAKEQNVGVDIAHKEENVLMAISDRETETEADNEVLSEFYHRYVTSGQVGYVEKHVENGSETASALRDMADMYSLIVVGKEGRGYSSPLITGISDWEECPELGKVGDFLASAEFDFCGSVLVMQQHRPAKPEDDD